MAVEIVVFSSEMSRDMDTETAYVGGGYMQ